MKTINWRVVRAGILLTTLGFVSGAALGRLLKYKHTGLSKGIWLLLLPCLFFVSIFWQKLLLPMVRKPFASFLGGLFLIPAAIWWNSLPWLAVGCTLFAMTNLVLGITGLLFPCRKNKLAVSTI